MDHFYVPPPVVEPETQQKALTVRRFPLPEATVRTWLKLPMPTHELAGFDATSPAFKQLVSQAPPNQVAVGHAMDMEAAALFQQAGEYDGRTLFLAKITARGAYGLRLRADLMGLRTGDALWLLDAEGAASFGPYNTGNANAGGQWLAFTQGDAFVVALLSADHNLPIVLFKDCSYFFKPVFLDNLPPPMECNISIAQESNGVVQEISSAVGRMLVPIGSGHGLCTATLLNSEKTRAGLPVPYLLSAWHCFGEGVDYAGIIVIWDYRRASADADKPDINAVPYNTGARLVDKNAFLDSVLIELNGQVEVGVYGRAWAGWDSQAPALNAFVQSIHHPLGADMKTSRGRVTNPETDVCMNALCSSRYDKQVEVIWSSGVTEQGSSGSVLLMGFENYRIAGVLSNGTTHSCTDSSRNLDNFGAFHVFFPQIGCHLLDGYVCQAPYEQESKSRCFLMRKMTFSPEMLQNLRLFRDGTLAKTSLGREMIRDYYELYESLNTWHDTSPAFRVLLHGISTLCAAWGASN